MGIWLSLKHPNTYSHADSHRLTCELCMKLSVITPWNTSLSHLWSRDSVYTLLKPAIKCSLYISVYPIQV